MNRAARVGTFSTSGARRRSSGSARERENRKQETRLAELLQRFRVKTTVREESQ